MLIETEAAVFDSAGDVLDVSGPIGAIDASGSARPIGISVGDTAAVACATAAAGDSASTSLEPPDDTAPLVMSSVVYVFRATGAFAVEFYTWTVVPAQCACHADLRPACQCSHLSRHTRQAPRCTIDYVSVPCVWSVHHPPLGRRRSLPQTLDFPRCVVSRLPTLPHSARPPPLWSLTLSPQAQRASHWQSSQF